MTGLSRKHLGQLGALSAISIFFVYAVIHNQGQSERSANTDSTTTGALDQAVDPPTLKSSSHSAQSYIFGYGSLINSKSRAKTADILGKAMPVRVRGLRRTWSFTRDDIPMTAVAVQVDPESITNGVIVRVDSSALVKFDERERGYVRLRVDPDHVTILDSTRNIDSKLPIWVYVKQVPMLATHEKPLAQTYIDTILAGCLEFGESFLSEFMENTFDWGDHWVNDRHAPVQYARKTVDQPSTHALIDDYLVRLIPDILESRLEYDAFHADDQPAGDADESAGDSDEHDHKDGL